MAVVKLQVCIKISNVLDNIKNSSMSVKNILLPFVWAGEGTQLILLEDYSLHSKQEGRS